MIRIVLLYYYAACIYSNLECHKIINSYDLITYFNISLFLARYSFILIHRIEFFNA